MTASNPKGLRKTEVRKNQIKENSFADRLCGAVVMTLSILIFLIKTPYSNICIS